MHRTCNLTLKTFDYLLHCFLQHATIFFDQYSRVYELINYSEHGTIVDNIIYTLNPVTGMSGVDGKYGMHSSIQSSFVSQNVSTNNNSGISHKGNHFTIVSCICNNINDGNR